MNNLQQPFNLQPYSYFYYEDYWGVRKNINNLHRPPMIILPPLQQSPRFNSPQTFSPQTFSPQTFSPRSDLSHNASPYISLENKENRFFNIGEDYDLESPNYLKVNKKAKTLKSKNIKKQKQ